MRVTSWQHRPASHGLQTASAPIRPPQSTTYPSCHPGPALGSATPGFRDRPVFRRRHRLDDEVSGAVARSMAPVPTTWARFVSAVPVARTEGMSARWAVALALGLRQGEALGLKWMDADLENGVLWICRSRRRPRYAHGCGERCGRKAGYCPQRRRTNPETAETKSRAGRRAVGFLRSWRSFCGRTACGRRPNARRPEMSGTTRGGSLPREPAGAPPPASTTTNGRSCYETRRSETPASMTFATRPRRSY